MRTVYRAVNYLFIFASFYNMIVVLPGISVFTFIGLISAPLLVYIFLSSILSRPVIPKEVLYCFFSLIFYVFLVNLSFLTHYSSVDIRVRIVPINLNMILLLSLILFNREIEDIENSFKAIWLFGLSYAMILLMNKYDIIDLVLASRGLVNYSREVYVANDANVAAFTLLLPFAINLAFLTFKQVKHAGVFLITLFIILAAIGQTLSRNGFIAIAVISATTLLLSRQKFYFSIIFATVVLAIAILALPDEYWMRMRSLQYLVNPDYEYDKAASISARYMAARLSVSAFLDKPVFGIGIDQFMVLSGNIGGKSLNTHSSPLEVMVELGILGLIALFLIFFSFIKGFRKFGESLYIQNAAPFIGSMFKIMWAGLLSGCMFLNAFHAKSIWILMALSISSISIAAKPMEYQVVVMDDDMVDESDEVQNNT